MRCGTHRRRTVAAFATRVSSAGFVPTFEQRDALGVLGQFCCSLSPVFSLCKAVHAQRAGFVAGSGAPSTKLLAVSVRRRT